MKSHFYILLAVITLLTSCIGDDVENHGAEKKSSLLQVGVATYSPENDPDVLGEAEYVIKRARLYAFDGNVLDNMVYKDNIDANNLGSLLMSLKVTQKEHKALYLIINEPDDPSIHSRLALINNPAAFETLEYEMADYFNQSTQLAFNNTTTNFAKDKFCLPMFGKLEDVNAAASSSPITVQMAATRSLARVDVLVQKQSDVNGDVKLDNQTKITINNTKEKGYYADYLLATATAGTLATHTNAATANALNVPTKAASGHGNAKCIFSFYTPERECSTSKLGFTLSDVDFTGKRMDFDVVIGNQENNLLDKINRNKIYQIYCTFTPKTTDVQINIKDWSLVSIDGSIVPSSSFYLSQSKVVMDWWNLGKKFDTSVSFASPDNVSFTAGDYYSKSGSNYTRLSSLPSWLHVDMTMLTTKTGNIKLTYSVTNGDHSDVYIKLKSGYITKYIRVVYDNGYFPAELLQTLQSNKDLPWTTSTPTNGILLSKGGPTLPSENATSSKWLYWTGKDVGDLSGLTMSTEHGTGLSNTIDIIQKRPITLATVAYSCYNLGEGWYLPSFNELQTIQNRNNYLGASYTMYNYLYWTSSRAQSVNVSTIRGIKGDVVINYPSRWTALTKCVKDM